IIMLSGSNPLDPFDYPLKKKNFFFQVGPSFPQMIKRVLDDYSPKSVAVSDNYYPQAQDKMAYELTVGRNREDNSWPMHILTEDEWRLIWNDEQAIKTSRTLLKECNAELPIGEMVKFKSKKSLIKLCQESAKEKGIDLEDRVYGHRLKREIALIKEKQFEDYFFVIADMLAYAKQHMFVGPARGSSCGSLVCYLLGITEIDPLKYGLFFERFIDINRADLPDIDIDFPDEKRNLVFDYLAKKYGNDCVARLGTVSRFKAKSTIVDVSKGLNIPPWEIADFKNAIIERPDGDARSHLCITDTFKEIIGRETLAKYPQLKIAEEIENHARHSGQHAAGVIVTAIPVHNFCSVDNRNGIAMIDLKDAEKLQLLKIDALGLRTLTIIEETLESINKPPDFLIKAPDDNKNAFKVLNSGSFAGIFQFEGAIVQELCKQIKVNSFEDMVALTSLARPGPLESGETTEYIARSSKGKIFNYPHFLFEDITKATWGVIIYQEQVMEVARNIGKLTWPQVSDLRKVMGKSLGREAFDKYWEIFEKGAKENGLEQNQIKVIWQSINEAGSYSFNRSHAVAYAMVSYWCCILKSRFPLEFAAATLRHAKDDRQSLNILRELDQSTRNMNLLINILSEPSHQPMSLG
ncbi:hypothetical protein LCGC14_2111510, partial [marine sediment metagenome]